MLRNMTISDQSDVWVIWGFVFCTQSLVKKNAQPYQGGKKLICDLKDVINTFHP